MTQPQTPRIPDFFIVGQAKSGTTALYEILRNHPALFLPRLKEPEFLAEDMRQAFQPTDRGVEPTSLDDYLALFAGASAAQLAGEASAFYLSSRTAASAIAALNGNARIIAIFREPSSFLRSLHLQLLQDQIEDERDLRRALGLQSERREGKSIPPRSYRPQVLQYSEHTRYTEQIARYKAVLPSEQILVLIYEEFRADNEATVRRILEFLGVDDTIRLTPVKANPTVATRWPSLDRAVHELSIGGTQRTATLKAIVKQAIPRVARRRILETVRFKWLRAPPPPPDEVLMTELRQSLKPEVERFAASVGRDLVTIWGYDVIEARATAASAD